MISDSNGNIIFRSDADGVETTQLVAQSIVLNGVDINELIGEGTPVNIDESLSETSTNPVQNKVVTNALNNKSDINHTQAASTISAGTFTGAVVAQASSQTPSTSLLRNSKLAETDTDPANNGEIVWIYA